MKQFMLGYYMVGEEPQVSDEEKQQGFQAFQAWMQSCGEAMIHPGVPLMNTKAVTADAVMEPSTELRLTGYSIVQVETEEEAIAMAQACPFVKMGQVYVSEMMQMPG